MNDSVFQCLVCDVKIEPEPSLINLNEDTRINIMGADVCRTCLEGAVKWFLQSYKETLAGPPLSSEIKELMEAKLFSQPLIVPEE